MFADVIFPLKIKPFTYKVPADMPSDLIGRIVKAPLGNRTLYGIVSDLRDTYNFECNSKKETIKEIISAHQHFGSPNTLALLKWLSEYYISPLGVGLNSCFFKEVVNLIDKSIAIEPTILYNKNIKLSKSSDNISMLVDAIEGLTFNTFLLHSPSYLYEKAFLNNLFKRTSSLLSGVIILVPEISQIEGIAKILKSYFGDRVCTIHSKQGRKKRLETIKGILSDKHNIIIGTRSAILMPIKKLSFIAVISEHSPSYKGEEGLRYNGRDVAVRRGLIENVPVLLSSICPSIESFYNYKTKKYYMIENSQTFSEIQSNSCNLFSPKNRPSIEIVNIWNAHKYRLSISKGVLSDAKKYLSQKESILFIVSKKGYSYIVCKECGYVFRCPVCQIPLIFYKTDESLKCHRCKQSKKIPLSCKVCNGLDLIPFGTGLERVKDELERFMEKETLQLDKGFELISTNDQFTPLIVGHGHQIKRIEEKVFKAAVFCDTDLYFLTNDFRANERIFQEVMEIAQLIKPDGRIYLQTKDIKNKTLNYIKNYNFKGFYDSEFALREETNLPPFKRLVLFNIFFKVNDNDTKQKVERLFSEEQVEGIELLGPREIPSSIKLHHTLQFLIKSRDRKRLNQLAHLLKEKLLILKKIKVITDVDPIRF